MKVLVVEEEWFPVYSILKRETKYGCEIDISETELAWIESVFSEFDKAQDFLREKTEANR